KYGLFVSSQVNITKPGAEGAHEIRALMDRLRGSKPGRFGAFEVVAVRDYATQLRTEIKSGEVTRLMLPKSNVLTFELAGGSRIIARPSGTEPKIKFYFDVREQMHDEEPLSDAETGANAAMKELARVFVALAQGEGEQGNRA